MSIPAFCPICGHKLTAEELIWLYKGDGKVFCENCVFLIDLRKIDSRKKK